MLLDHGKCVFFFSPHFGVFHDLLQCKHMATPNLFVYMIKKENIVTNDKSE